MLITRRLEFDAGHRIPHHKSQCRHMHGHRYAIEISLSGSIINTPGSSEEGMVMDFSDVKAIARSTWWNRGITPSWCMPATPRYRFSRISIEGHKTVVARLRAHPENLAAKAFQILDLAYRDTYGNNLRLERVRISNTQQLG